jgi:hypothetical protein
VGVWDQIRHFLRNNWRVAKEGDDWVGALGVSPLNGEVVRFRVQRGRMADDPWLVVLVDVCPASELPMREALARNVGLPVGSYALEAERVVLRAALAIAPDILESLPGTIDKHVAEAARRRGAIAGRRQGAALFTDYED